MGKSENIFFFHFVFVLYPMKALNKIKNKDVVIITIVFCPRSKPSSTAPQATCTSPDASLMDPGAIPCPFKFNFFNLFYSKKKKKKSAILGFALGSTSALSAETVHSFEKKHSFKSQNSIMKDSRNKADVLSFRVMNSL